MTTARTIMLALCSLVIATCRITAVMPTPTTYDQRQNGDLNVQVDVKDVRVVALLDSQLLDDYTDYDYFYDYADFTVKPSGRPTTSTTTRATEVNDVTRVAEAASSVNPTVSAPSDRPTASSASANEEAPSNGTGNGTANSTSNAYDNDKSQSSEENRPEATVDVLASSTTVRAAPRSRGRCRPGYVPNGDGRCRRANRRWLSLLP